MLRNINNSFLRCIGFFSFIEKRIKHDLLQTQVCVLLLIFYIIPSCLAAVKHHVIGTVKGFMRGQVKFLVVC